MVPPPQGPRQPAPPGLFDPMTPAEMLARLEMRAGVASQSPPVDTRDEGAVFEEYGALVEDMEAIDSVMDHLEERNAALERKLRAMLEEGEDKQQGGGEEGTNGSTIASLLTDEEAFIGQGGADAEAEAEAEAEGEAEAKSQLATSDRSDDTGLKASVTGAEVAPK